MTALVGSLMAIFGALLLTWSLSTPVDQLITAAVGGFLVGLGLVKAAAA